MVLKAGEVVVEQGEIRREVYGRTLHVAPATTTADVPDIKKWFEAYYTIQFANYPVDETYLSHGGVRVGGR